VELFKEVHEYLHQVTPSRPAVMQQMEQYAREHDFPIVGPLVGRLLQQLAMAIDATKIFELGSGFGYSAYWFSMAVGNRGQITLTDGNADNRDRALNYLSQAGLESKFEFIVGDALTALKATEGPFDIIFNDIDKEGYPGTIDTVAQKLRKGGLFITDNLIWDGKVCDDSPDDTTRAILEFTAKLYADQRFFVTVVPLRDGVGIATRM
jgi:predicted O-methyltransferase YrrM